MEGVDLSPGFWSGRRVLLTGHTGFKGAWLALWLQRLGARVTGLALAPDDAEGAYVALGPWPGLESHLRDIRDRDAVGKVVSAADPEVVFHLAAQPLVRAGFDDPVATYDVNVMGTVHLLAALAAAPSLRGVVLVTTDKVYADAGDGRSYAETDVLGGNDAYSASKACVEVAARSWHWTDPAPAVATARAGNVIGGGDVAPDRLVPDALRALRAGVPLRLRYPGAVRPWQFVLEALHGYLLLGQHLAEAGGPEPVPAALNFGPPDDACIPVADLVDRLFALAGAGSWELEPDVQPYETSVLRLDAALAGTAIGWRPLLGVDEALAWTLAWWRAAADGADLRALASDQIERYERILARP